MLRRTRTEPSAPVLRCTDRRNTGPRLQFRMLTAWFSLAVLPGWARCCRTQLEWAHENPLHSSPQAQLQSPRALRLQQKYTGRSLRQEEWSGEVQQQPGVNPEGVEHLVHLPRKFKPPDANYTIIRDADEYIDVISKATGSEIYVRFHESTLFIDVGKARNQKDLANMALAPNVTYVLDCQGGAIVSDPLMPWPEPAEGSFFDGYGCVWFGTSSEGGGFAQDMRLSDMWLVYPCAVCLFCCLSCFALHLWGPGIHYFTKNAIE